MKKSDKNHTESSYLAKWLNNELTDMQLKEHISDADFNVYEKIKKGVGYFEAPDFDAKKIQFNIKKNISQKKVKKIHLQRNIFLASAAAIALLFSLYFYTGTLTSNFKTTFGEQKTVVLLDGSEVELNAKATLNYKNKNWNSDRKVTLKGEAFFKVNKGSTFQVETENGTVTVLGTKFNINSQSNFFSVQCYEGKVMVIQEKDTIYLTKGNAYQRTNAIIEKWNFSENTPSWQNGETSFKSAPLHIVISSLEKQFGIEITSKNIDVNELFTGSFSNSNLEMALKSVFIPMQINYLIKNKKVFLSKK
jgi:transmembrane sensor